MKVLILAAGRGERLQQATDAVPKGLISVAGTALIRHQLAFLDHPAAKEIGVVVGYQASVFKAFLKKEAPNISIFENRQFTEGSILSVKSALSFLTDDFLLMNVDHIYPKRLLARILKQVEGITAVCDFDRRLADDDMKIKKKAGGFIADIHKELKEYDGGYIGMTYCPKSKLDIYKKGMETVLQTEGPKASAEMILRELAKSNETIHIADASGLRWLEVDTPGDLKRAQETLTTDPRFLS